MLLNNLNVCFDARIEIINPEDVFSIALSLNSKKFFPKLLSKISNKAADNKTGNDKTPRIATINKAI